MLVMLPLAVMKVSGCVLINFDSSLIMSPLYFITVFHNVVKQAQLCHFAK